jgi:putative ABC transport system permease protein
MASLLQDFRYALRLLLKSPGFTMLAVLTLGLGIGANVTVFSVLNSVMIRSLPLPQPEQLVHLYSDWEPALPNGYVSAPDFLDCRERNTLFAGLAGCRIKDVGLQRSDGAENITLAAVSANYFQLIGMRPGVGRGFTPGENESSDSHVVVLSESLCRRLFGSNEGILGRSIQLNAESYTVVGIMPGDFHFPEERVQLWIPLHFTESQLRERGIRWLSVYGRLKPEVTLAQAGAQMSNIAANIAREDPVDNTGFGIRLVPLQEDIVGKSVWHCCCCRARSVPCF